MNNREVVDISIIIPVYNRSLMLREAITSCFESGVGLNLQVIVVDDASIEPLAEVIESVPVHLIRLDKNQGSAQARNIGMANATGRYIKFLDSDDLLEPGALREEFDLAIRQDADIVISGFNQSVCSSDGAETLLKYTAPPVIRNHVDDLLSGYAVPTSSALYKRRYLAGVAWDSELAKLNDWDFFLQAALKEGLILSLDRPAYRWRHHPGSRITDASLLTNAMEFFHILDKVVDVLQKSGRITKKRQQRLAQYYYKELRMAFRFAPELGEHYLQTVFKLDPDFLPYDEEHSRIFRLLTRLFPLHGILVVYGVCRRAWDRMTGNAA